MKKNIYNQPTNQPTNQTNNQPTNQPTNQPNNQLQNKTPGTIMDNQDQKLKSDSSTKDKRFWK